MMLTFFFLFCDIIFTVIQSTLYDNILYFFFFTLFLVGYQQDNSKTTQNPSYLYYIRWVWTTIVI